MSEYIKMNDTPVYNYQNDIIKELNKELAKFRPFKSAYEMKKEIERLNKRIEDLSIINEEHQTLNKMIRKELKQKENIIKEVREYIQDYFYIDKETGEYYFTHTFDKCNVKELLEILDKENK